MGKKTILLFILSTILSGCQTITVNEMLPKQQFSEPIDYTVTKPTVAGRGKWVQYMGDHINTSVEQLTMDFFKQVKLFRQVKENNGDYTFKVFIDKYDRVLSGFNMFVDVTIKYKLTNTRTNKIVFYRKIKSFCKKGVGDYLSGLSRRRKVVACAVSENLSKLFYALQEEKENIQNQAFSLDSNNYLESASQSTLNEYENIYKDTCKPFRNIEKSSSYKQTVDALDTQCHGGIVQLCNGGQIRNLCFNSHKECHRFVVKKSENFKYTYGERKGLVFSPADRRRFTRQACEHIK